MYAIRSYAPFFFKQDDVKNVLGGQIFMMAALGFTHRQRKSNLYVLVEHRYVLYGLEPLRASAVCRGAASRQIGSMLQRNGNPSARAMVCTLV